MKENTQEKGMIENKGIFSKIKNFFKNIFVKKQEKENNENLSEIKEHNNEFKENLKMNKEEEEKLLELQNKYRNGEIHEGDLTDEQIDSLCDLYDKQIAELKVAIEKTNREIEQYKKIKMEKNKA